MARRRFYGTSIEFRFFKAWKLQKAGGSLGEALFPESVVNVDDDDDDGGLGFYFGARGN